MTDRQTQKVTKFLGQRTDKEIKKTATKKRHKNKNNLVPQQDHFSY